jgi:hypothetical protein
MYLRVDLSCSDYFCILKSYSRVARPHLHLSVVADLIVLATVKDIVQLSSNSVCSASPNPRCPSNSSPLVGSTINLALIIIVDIVLGVPLVISQNSPS